MLIAVSLLLTGSALLAREKSGEPKKELKNLRSSLATSYWHEDTLSPSVSRELGIRNAARNCERKIRQIERETEQCHDNK